MARNNQRKQKDSFIGSGIFLVGDFKPNLKNISQIGSFP